MNINLSIFILILFQFKRQQLPLVRWERNNNATHGVLKAYVDLTTGRRPSNVKVYYARTFDNKRRDFRLIIADPNNSSKIIPHPGNYDYSQK